MSAGPALPHVVEKLGTTTRVVKFDEAGMLVSQDTAHVLDTYNSSVKLWTSLVKMFHYVFLPEGFPSSVSADYSQYQLWDTLQALCSSVTGTLSTRAVLQGVGVGEAEATLMSGTLSWVLRDGTGMVARIAFASYIASDLDNDAKRWRLAADVTNDVALMLEIMSSHLPRMWFITVICIASVFRAITGVAGGSSRASLTQHFAVRGNTADVSAKDGSQETAVSLLGMFVGMAVAALVPAESFLDTAIVFAVFTGLHLVANYFAVSSLVLDTYNKQRMDIALSRALHTARVEERGNAIGEAIPSPVEMKKLEGIIWTADVVRKLDLRITLGVSLAIQLQRTSVSSARAVLAQKAIASLTRDNCAIFVHNSSDASNIPQYAVVCTQVATARVIMRAYFHAAWHHVHEVRSGPKEVMAEPTLLPLESRVDAEFQSFIEMSAASGWNVQKCQLRVYDWRVDIAGEEKQKTS